MGPIASPRKSQHLGLDAKAEYMDTDGVMRRSEKVTQRMIQRGLSIKKAHTLTDDDQLHMSYDERLKESDARAAKLAKGQQELTQKQAANASLKVQTKAERRQWIIESNELIETRLQYWYTNEFVSHDDENVDVTEKNTPLSPSKQQRFIDEKGNLRRKSIAPVAPSAEVPAQQGLAKDHSVYVQVVTPPISPAQ